MRRALNIAKQSTRGSRQRTGQNGRVVEALGQPSDDLSLERLRTGTAVAAVGIEPAPPLFPRVELPAAAP